MRGRGWGLCDGRWGGGGGGDLFFNSSILVRAFYQIFH